MLALALGSLGLGVVWVSIGSVPPERGVAKCDILILHRDKKVVEGIGHGVSFCHGQICHCQMTSTTVAMSMGLS